MKDESLESHVATVLRNFMEKGAKFPDPPAGEEWCNPCGVTAKYLMSHLGELFRLRLKSEKWDEYDIGINSRGDMRSLCYIPSDEKVGKLCGELGYTIATSDQLPVFLPDGEEI